MKMIRFIYILDEVNIMDMKMLDHDMVLNILPDRKADTHKGDYGKILLLCGSRGYTGAAALAAMGALRSGAGLVFLGVPESIYSIEAVKLTEPVVFPLPDEKGMFSAKAILEIDQRLSDMSAVLIGPGMGNCDETFCIVKHVLQTYNGPVVLDADGINVLASHIDILRDRTGITILTPHGGEFKRIFKSDSEDRVVNAVSFAQKYGAILVLKGHRTVITDGKECFVNLTGNPGMAVGGSGDVLAGIITSLLGQGISALKAAACGVWLHGAAGDICANELGQYGLLPSDMLSVLPRLMK